MFRFDHSVNMPSKIGIFMGRITTFRRVRKYHLLLNSYDWNDCLSVETTKTEKVVTLWAYVGQEERLMVTMTDEQKGLFFSYNDCIQEFNTLRARNPRPLQVAG